MTPKIERAKQRIATLDMMVKKAEALGRMPVKSDFTEDEIFLIKKEFGPLPRALEAAGLKDMTEQYKEKLKRKKNKKQ